MKILIKNRKAHYNYNITDTYEVGIVLVGSEVKSIRNGNISINESFIVLKDFEVFLKNAYIKPYEKTSMFQPESRRSRKLLLKKEEIIRIKRKMDTQKLALVPLKVYFKRNKVKLEIGLGKGKKLYDKRETIKERTLKRNLVKEGY